MNNHVDLDPGPGILDYACGAQTYDGHTGMTPTFAASAKWTSACPYSLRWTAK